MKELLRYLREEWANVLVTGIAIPIALTVILTGNWVVMAITLPGLFGMVLAVFVLAERFRQRQPKTIGESGALQIPRRGMVFLVGRQTATLELTLDWLQAHQQMPAHFGFVYSAASRAEMEALVAHYELSNRTKLDWGQVDPFDVKDVSTSTQKLLRWLIDDCNLAEREIVVDVTGGTTLMSLGAFLAAEGGYARKKPAWRIETQYLKSDYRENKPVPGTQEWILLKRYYS